MRGYNVSAVATLWFEWSFPHERWMTLLGKCACEACLPVERTEWNDSTNGRRKRAGQSATPSKRAGLNEAQQALTEPLASLKPFKHAPLGTSVRVYLSTCAGTCRSRLWYMRATEKLDEGVGRPVAVCGVCRRGPYSLGPANSSTPLVCSHGSAGSICIVSSSHLASPHRRVCCACACAPAEIRKLCSFEFVKAEAPSSQPRLPMG